MMQILSFIDFFVGNPAGYAIVGLFFFIVCGAIVLVCHKMLLGATIPLIVAGTVWGLFALWEHHCKMIGANIRVDLLLLWPILGFVTVVCVVLALLRLW